MRVSFLVDLFLFLQATHAKFILYSLHLGEIEVTPATVIQVLVIDNTCTCSDFFMYLLNSRQQLAMFILVLYAVCALKYLVEPTELVHSFVDVHK